ncbi:adenine phosphoribosyltransferase [Candidatus Tachikawaea gelatinosa]|uniref:Adenine phosphoribosyltransferase n=1 Tax=Candidatus Tachikawaea gelatinosa TaxID=1410383 RepID=A0A090BWL8_9ENTR|nr:adenine phosphoribosyltransferase [Candidatus Tachikawaea gelatinosa]BAP58831.1 adenine phosphoribosyltransferase [Candidatus Tachikawaea gelatinosa]
MEKKTILLIKKLIKNVPNFPKPGIIFRDISNILDNPQIYSQIILCISNHYYDKKITKIAGIEARGFLFGAPVALNLGIGFVPIRKPNKLPRAKYSEKYNMEYSSNSLEIHKDAISSVDKVLIIDDILATGSTVSAAVKLIRKTGKVNDAAFLMSLHFLKADKKLEKININCFNIIKITK